MDLLYSFMDVIHMPQKYPVATSETLDYLKRKLIKQLVHVTNAVGI
jgi:hypothetical protein